MSHRQYLQLCIIPLLVILSCGKKEQQSDSFDINNVTSSPVLDVVEASSRIDLTSKGVGPIESLVLPDTIDQAFALTGKHIYEENCMICHKPTEKFIGPAPQGILDRRTPEWVMNMILNPERMLKDDSLARDLFLEFNGSPMANQHLSEVQARAILEYFRTL
ncbi:MAG: c-type cytochrome [Cyclobacteriaceae bacterium]